MSTKTIPVLQETNKAVEALGMLTGFNAKPNDPILSWTLAELEAEFKRILSKKSKLSANQRALVLRRYWQKSSIESHVKLLKEVQEQNL